MRFERKFKIKNKSIEFVKQMILMHPFFFHEIFYERWVCNIYFDDLDFSDYFSNVQGVAERKKIRIRWYVDNLGICTLPNLEVKSKIGLVGEKSVYQLPKCDFSKENIYLYIKELTESDILDDRVRLMLKQVHPVLMNHYKRSYYETVDKKYRLTVDSDLHFSKVDEYWKFSKKVSNPDIIMELKYAVENDDGAAKIASLFPFRLTKSSKYVQGFNYLFST